MTFAQEEEERKVRRNFQPTRRTAQQVKADEDFALRMQRQEREIASHQVAYYQEMQRRQQSLYDMGGVPQQPPQVSCLSPVPSTHLCLLTPWAPSP